MGFLKDFNLFNRVDSSKIENIHIKDYFDLDKKEFVFIFLKSLYKRIFDYCWSRTILKNKKNFKETILNDCFLKTEQQKGFISLLSEAIIFKKQQILTYDKALNLIETKDFTKSYDFSQKKKYEIVIDFSNDNKINLLIQYASIYYDCLRSLAEKSKTNGALILKIASLTNNIALEEWRSAGSQAQSIQTGINNGKGAILDSNSSVELLNSNIDAERQQLENIKQEISCCFDGLPINFLFGTSTAGIGATGENDTDSLERSINSFFNNYWKPYFDGMFEENITFKIENWRQIEKVKDVINIVETSDYLDENLKKEIVLNIFKSIKVIE